MDPIFLVLGSVTLIAVAVLCIVGVVFLLDAKRQLARVVTVTETAGRDISELRKALDPVLTEARTMLVRTTETLERIDIQLEKVGKGADVFKDIAEDVRAIEQRVVAKVAGPIDDITGLFAGTVKGITTFIRKLGAS